MKSARGRLLLSLLVGPAFLGSAEAVLALAGWPPPFLGIGLPVSVPYDVLARSWEHAELDPELLFRLRPGPRRLGVHPINSLGLVGPEASRVRTPGTIRVVCLGDSTTLGIGEVPGRSYPDLLRGMFARAFGEGRVEVLNAGVPTYTSTQCLRRFLREILPLRPDVLVAYHGGHNEFQASPMTVAEVSARLSRPGTRFLHSSRVARALRCAIGAAFPETARHPGAGTVNVPLAEFRRDLESLAAECGSRGIGLVLAVPPHSAEKRSTEPVCASYAAAVREAALRGAGADTAALFDGFAPYPLWTEPVHPNLQGYRLLARALYEAILASPAIEPLFTRAGADLSALRSFEALAARAESADPGGEAWRGLEADLRGVKETSPEVERARGIVELRLGGAALSEGRLADLGFGEDDLAKGLVGLLAGKDAEALRLVRAARPAHPDRPGVAALEETLRISVSGGGGGPESGAGAPETVRREIAPTDPLDRALAGARSAEEIRRSQAPVSAALLLLLHRDRILGAPAGLDRRVGRAALAATRGDATGARALLEAALASNRAEVHALAQLGALEFAHGNDARARDLFERAVGADPAQGAAWIHLAALAVRRGETGNALSCLDACLEARPYLAGARLLRAQLRKDRGDLAGAREDLARARDLDPGNPDVRRLSEEVGRD